MGSFVTEKILKVRKGFVSSDAKLRRNASSERLWRRHICLLTRQCYTSAALLPGHWDAGTFLFDVMLSKMKLRNNSVIWSKIFGYFCIVN